MDWTELLNWSEYSKLLIGLIIMTDPIGNLPLVLSMTEKLSAPEKSRVLLSASLTFAVTLLIFNFLGTFILDIFGITIEAFKIAGGIMFLFYGLEMMDIITLPTLVNEDPDNNPATIGIVPIGIPMLAGPATISTIIIYSGYHSSLEHDFLVSAVIITVSIILYLGFRVWLAVGSKANPTALSVLKKIMGLILTAIAIELILDGIAKHYPLLRTAGGF